MTSTNEFPNNGGYFGYKSTTINPETIENSISNYDDCFKNKSVKPIDDQRHYSFDVFDTAVCRLVHSPEHIHLVVGRKLRNRGHTNYSDAEWMYIRAQSEFRSRSKFDHNEVTISDIYGVMSTLIGWSAERARIAIDLELEEELRLVKPIIGIKLLIETHIKQSKNVFFTSDTYFQSDFVSSLLSKAGYRPPLNVICSSEEKKSKIHATIYDYISRKKGIENSSFYHLGDNLFSDVQNARSKGWNAQAFTDSHWTTRERVLAASGDGGFLSSAIAGSARSARLGQIRPFKEGIVTAAASVVGPMFTAYTLWVLLDVLNRGGRVIYFLARDGQVLAKICQRLARWLNIDVDICYIYASRQAFLLPALHNEGDNIINEALKLSYYDQIDLEEALTSLNYSSEELVYIAKLLPYNLRRISSSLSHNEMSALKAALSRKDLLKSLRARVHEAYFATLAYLDSKGMLSSSEACIVDLGWRGSTQLRLQKILGNNVKLRGYYMGISNSVLSAEDCICRWTTKVSLKTGLLEVMASSDHTTVKGFTFSLDGQPDCSPPIVEDKTLVQWGSRQQQEVALRFCDYLLEAVEVDTFTAQEFYQALKDAGLDAYHHFRLSPTWVEAEAYGSMPHQIDVNHAKFQELAPSVHNVDILRKILRRKSQGFNTSWYMGSIARSSNKSNLAKSIHLLAGRYIEFKARFITRKRRKDLDKFARHLLKS